MPIATLGSVVLDCPEPRKLADFYRAVLGWEEDPSGDADWLDIVGPEGRRLSFQRSLGYQPPQWPETAHGQQIHMDFDVPKAEMDQAEQRLLALGATVLQGDGGGARTFRVYADPAGHPFCLCAG